MTSSTEAGPSTQAQAFGSAPNPSNLAFRHFRHIKHLLRAQCCQALGMQT